MSNRFAQYVFLFLLTFVASMPVHARTIKVDGGDLTMITRDAKSGDVIKLSANNYVGQILVEGKKLRIVGPKRGWARLSSDANSLVHVTKGGSLKLERNIRLNVEQRGQVAVYIKKGSAKIARCQVNGNADQMMTVDKGSLELSHCILKDGGNQAIVISNNSSLKTHMVTMVRFGNRAIVIEKNSLAVLDRTEMKRFGEIGLLGINSSIIKMKDVDFSEGRSTAIHIEKNSSLKADNLAIRKVNGYGIVGLGNSTVEVAKSHFNNLSGIALVMTGVKALSLTDSDLDRVGQAVVVSRGAAAVTIGRNRINKTQAGTDAISVSAAGSVDVTGNTLLNVDRGIILHGKISGKVSIVKNRIYNSKNHAIYLAVPTGWVMVLQNRLVNTGTPSIMIDKGTRAELKLNLVLSKSKYGVYVQNDSSVKFNSNTIHGFRNSIYYHSSSGVEGSMKNDMLTRKMHRSSRHAGMRTEARVTSMLADPKRSQDIRQAIVKLLSRTERVKGLKDLKSFALEMKKFNSTLESFQAKALGLSSVTLLALDAGGQEFTAKFEVYTTDGKLVSKNDESNPVAIVDPGTYRVKFEASSLPPQEVVIRQGENRKLHIDMPNHIVLSLAHFNRQKGWILSKLPFRMRKSGSRGMSTFGGMVRYASRRAGVSQADISATLDAVRTKLADFRKQYRSASSGFTKRNRLSVFAQKAGNASERHWYNALRWVHSVLAVGGTAKDAEELMNLARSEALLRYDRVSLAAWIEKRLGILGSGAVKGSLRVGTTEVRTYAAAMLMLHGDDSGEAVLLANLKTPANNLLTLASVNALQHSRNADVKAAMVSVVKAFLAQKARLDAGGKKAKYPALLWRSAVRASLYLFAHGDRDAIRVASGMIFSENHYRDLMQIVQDPRPLVDFYLGFRGPLRPRYRPDWVAGLCTTMDSLPGGKRTAFLNAFETSLIKAGTLNRISKKGSRADVEQARAEYSIAVSRCKPSSAAARLVANKESRYLLNTPWIFKPWLFSQAMDNFRTGARNAGRELEHFEYRLLANAIGNPRIKDTVRFPSFYLALRKTGSTRCGMRRCAFVLSPSGDKGTVSGAVRVKTGMKRGRLNVTLKFDLASHPYDLLARIAPARRKHGISTTAMQARALVKEVYIRKGKRKQRLRRVGRKSLQYQYRPGRKGNLNNAWLYVRLSLYGESATLAFPVFVN